MVEIISIGDELLIGQVVNTNASWMAEELNGAGFDVRQITCVSDTGDEIMRALQEASQRVEVILMTGGLGPTRDDITKEVLCRYFATDLVMDPQVLEKVHSFFRMRDLPISKINEDQALVPRSAVVIENNAGTAPGLAFEKDNRFYVAMPGVPFEMKHIMETYVLPRLQTRADARVIIHRTILTQGIGESYLSEKICDWENNLGENLKLAYLPSVGVVRLRLSMHGSDRATMETVLDEKVAQLKLLVAKYIWGEGKQTFEEITGLLLKASHRTISTAESCTGGYIAHRITSVAGSSAWFKGSVVAYDNHVKTSLLGVEPTVLQHAGAVSKEVVEQMARGVMKLLNTDFSIAVSGIAGPEGGTAEKPVGTVWIAVAGPGERVRSEKFLFGDHRERNIFRSANAALAMLRELLLQ